MSTRASRPLVWLVIPAFILSTGIGGLAVLDARHGTLREEHIDQTIVWYIVAVLGFLFAVWWNERHPIRWRWIWVVAIVLRLVMFTTTPTLSDDVYRYLWEGHLVTEGVSPYEAPILDPSLDLYEIPARFEANTPTFASPYLPTAHGVFGLAALLLPSEPLSMQVVMTGFELVAAAGLGVLLRIVGMRRDRVLLWLWNPLVIVEAAHGAHLDALMVALAVSSLVLTLDPRLRESTAGRLGAPGLLALATLTRPIPMLLFPVLFWRWNWTQRVVYVAVSLALLVPFGLWSGFGFDTDTPRGLFGASRVYSESFRFNSAIYQTIESWIGGLGFDDQGWNEPVVLTRLLVGAIFAALILGVWARARRARSALETLRLAAVPAGAYVLLAPVMHPWYLLLLVALLIFQAPLPGEPRERWALLAPWAWIIGAIVLSYLTYRDPNSFAELVWVRRVEWWPVLVLGVVVGVVGRLSAAHEQTRNDAEVSKDCSSPPLL